MYLLVWLATSMIWLLPFRFRVWETILSRVLKRTGSAALYRALPLGINLPRCKNMRDIVGRVRYGLGMAIFKRVISSCIFSSFFLVNADLFST